MAKIAVENWLEKIFTSYGFAVKTVDYDEVARAMQRIPPLNPCNFLFIAEHIRFSDKQVIVLHFSYGMLKMEFTVILMN